MDFVKFVVKSTWLGITCEYAGTSSTSSNVIPSPMILPISFPLFHIQKISVLIIL